MKTKWLIPVLLLALACGCSQRKEILPEAQTPVLRTITVSAYTLVLPEGESAQVEFTVKDAAYPFNYTVGSSGCQVKLLLPGGREPADFYLKEVISTDTPGTYLAVIADAETDSRYDTRASIAIVSRNADTGVESIVQSAGINISVTYDPLSKVTKTGLPVVYMNTESGRDITSKTTFVNGQSRGDWHCENA